MIDIDSLKDEARQIMLEYGNGVVYAGAFGQKKYAKLHNENMRVHYLYGLINNIVQDTDFYIGDGVVTDDYVLESIEKLRHYKGVGRNIDLTDVGTITEEIAPVVPDPAYDYIRTGAEAVVAGQNVITFSSALNSALYVLDCWVMTSDGDRQSNLGISAQVAGGFTVDDVIDTGTLYYTAIMKI